jgi:hypothetical protein
MNNNSICFTTFVFGCYQKFIPYYIYSTSKLYPEAFVKIFVEDKLEKNVLEALEIISNSGFTSFEILISDFNNVLIFDNYKIKGGGCKTLFRWLFDYKHFQDFKYLYYGDIDILMFSDKISLLDLHKNKIKEFNVPFSNMVRKDELGNLTNRLTGLHFVETKPYFDKVNPIIKRIFECESYRIEIMKNVIRDENLLYNINKKAFVFDDNQLHDFKRPLYGLHFGIARNKKDLTIEYLLDSNPYTLVELKQKIVEINSDKIFKRIQKLIFLKEHYDICKFLNVNNNIDWKGKYYKYLFTKVLIKIKIKILYYWNG